MEDYKIIYEHKITEDNEERLIVKDSYNGKEDFEYEAAITVLLLERKLLVNSNWWRDDLSEEMKSQVTLFVLCNDVFAWGCADAESLNMKEVEDLFNHYEKDNEWGTEVWCIKKRGYLPQKPVFDIIQKKGIWDLTKMEIKDGLNWKLEKTSLNLN